MPSNPRLAVQPALTRVSRQLRLEALPLFYQLNRFVAHIHRADFSYLLSYVNLIGGQNIRNLRRIRLDLGHESKAVTCGTGLLDFVRWLAVEDAADDIRFDFTGSKFNSRLFESALLLGFDIGCDGNRFEPRLRKAFTEWLRMERMECICDIKFVPHCSRVEGDVDDVRCKEKMWVESGEGGQY